MVCSLLLAGCHNRPSEPKIASASATPSGTATPEASAAATPSPTPEPPREPPVPAAALKRAAKLPLEQRVGQLFVVGFDGFDLSAPVFRELQGHGWGGIFMGPTNVFDLAGVGVLAGEARAVAENSGRVPPLVSSFDDGRPPRLGSDQREGRTRAADAAAAASAQGVTLTTAPFINVGIGADADLISRVAPVAIGAWVKGGVASAPAHFPGQGTVNQDPLDGPANVGLSVAELDDRDLKPWVTALKEAPAVTVSSATFTAFDPVTPAALTPGIVRGLLREQMRFGGVAMTDDLNSVVAATGLTPPKAAVEAIRTGIDVVFVPTAADRAAVYEAVLKAAKSGKIGAGRIREAAGRVLALKASL